MIRGRDVRAGLRAGGAWLAVSVVLIIVGRLLGDGPESLVGALLVPLGLFGAPGQLAVAWSTIQKPAATLNGFVAGLLAGLGSAAAVLILGVPFGVALLTHNGPADAAARATAIGLVTLLVYTVAVVCWLFTIFTSVSLAIIEAPAADEL